MVRTEIYTIECQLQQVAAPAKRYRGGENTIPICTTPEKVPLNNRYIPRPRYLPTRCQLPVHLWRGG